MQRQSVSADARLAQARGQVTWATSQLPLHLCQTSRLRLPAGDTETGTSNTRHLGETRTKSRSKAELESTLFASNTISPWSARSTVSREPMLLIILVEGGLPYDRALSLLPYHESRITSQRDKYNTDKGFCRP